MSSGDPGYPRFSAYSRLVGGVPVVEVSGEMDLKTVPLLRSAVEEAAGHAGDPPIVVVDLDGVEFIENLGVGLLVEQKGKLRERGGELRLVLGESRIVRKLLRLLDLEGAFAVYPDSETAVEGSVDNA